MIVQQIDQNIITLYNKLAIFQGAFEKKNEPKKIEKLYKEAFYLVKNTNDFNLLLFLFIHIYDKKFVYSIQEVNLFLRAYIIKIK